MGRKIKFRVWDKDNKRMVYYSYPNISIEYNELTFSGDGDSFGDSGMGEAVKTLMQYTGLKDKNGKEIYEGDIIRVNGRNMEVFFKDGYFGWGQEHDGKYSFDPFGDEKIEVIGNIYENPELIKEK